VLVPEKHEGDNALLEMMGKAMEPIHNFKDIKPVLEQAEGVEQFLPVGKNMAMVLNDNGSMPFFQFVLGVDFERYRRMFPGSLNLIEGEDAKAEHPGLLLPAWARKEINDLSNVWFIPGGAVLDTSHLETEDKKRPGDLNVKSDMVLMGFNEDNTSTDIRMKVNGVFRYKALNTIFGHFALMDIESYRQVLGYFLTSEKEAGRVSGKDSALFGTPDENLDALFDGDSLMVANQPAAAAPVDWTRKEPIRPEGADLDLGTYNLVFVLLRSGVDAEQALVDLNALLKKNHLGVRAISWKSALGQVGSMALLIKGALFVFVGILFLVAVIIIVNTLTMAAMERKAEIGMMRAIGARKGFVGRMFLAETGVLSLTFGGLGIVLGAVTVEILAWLRFTSENDMLQLFYGGDTFRPLLMPGDFVLAFLQLGFVTVAAVLYPFILARGVKPLDAVYKE